MIQPCCNFEDLRGACLNGARLGAYFLGVWSLDTLLLGDTPTDPGVVKGLGVAEREFFIDHLLVRVHFIIVMIRWTGLAPWDFEFPFSR